MQIVFKVIDAVLSKIPYLNGRKTLLGVLAFGALSILNQCGVIDAETTLRLNAYVTIWSGIAVVHKGAKVKIEK
jgi:hypothetical protein